MRGTVSAWNLGVISAAVFLSASTPCPTCPPALPGASCSFAVLVTGTAEPAGCGNVAVRVTAQPGCLWTFQGNAPWITVVADPDGAPNGNGNGTVVLQVAANTGAYMDLSFAGSYSQARELSLAIKKEITEEEKLTASVGIGPNTLIAKIASDFQKPDGLTVVRAEEAEEFLAHLPVRKIPGIGPKTEKMLAGKGITLVRHLKQFSREELQAWLGKWGLALYEKVRGRGSETLSLTWEPKSIGEQDDFQSRHVGPEFNI